MKNLVLFIVVMLMYGSNVSAQVINTALKANILTIDVPSEVYATADIHDIVFNARIHDIVFNRVQPLDVTICMEDGRQVYSEKLEATNNVITLDTQHLPEASYILYLRADDGRTFTSKFVKL